MYLDDGIPHINMRLCHDWIFKHYSYRCRL
jgi:hypothetical protein